MGMSPVGSPSHKIAGSLTRMKLLLLCVTLGPSLVSSQFDVPATAPRNDVFEAFVSFSIEFSSLPDYAGMASRFW